MNSAGEKKATMENGLEEPICGYTGERVLREIEAFHGFVAPGLVIGAIMVDWVQERLEPMVEADAIVETCHCLPDAVQIFTPCTIGNGWLKILDWDQFALTLYDRFTLKGYRVWLDPGKLKAFPPVHDWYMRTRPKKDLPRDVLIPAILSAGRDLLSCVPIRMTRFYARKKKGDIGICPTCGEAYARTAGDQCMSCGE
ncbi:MAG: formylmethanofuran dehydrogenase subunit E family protein [Deltaproteobacteria bacterium]|nr:formylmethanofuran dehydrogenase subunit E family protein [Deltaproteobacteria bacterium]